MIAAQDETYRDAKNIHSKYRRYQAFESEIASNKDRLNKLQQVQSQSLGALSVHVEDDSVVILGQQTLDGQHFVICSTLSARIV